jgi:hypothetical protein
METNMPPKTMNPDHQPPPEPAVTNQIHPTAPGALKTVPGLGVVGPETETSQGHDSNAPATAPGAQRVGTTEGRAATAARGGVRGGLQEMEAPSAGGQTALNPATGGAGAPSPGSSGIRATADPNFDARSAEEEGVPSPEALAEQKASIKNSNHKTPNDTGANNATKTKQRAAAP